MEITLELSYYPLQNEYEEIVSAFINELMDEKRIRIDIGVMSSLITGEYRMVMDIITEKMEPYLKKYPSIFKFSISNACNTCKMPEN